MMSTSSSSSSVDSDLDVVVVFVATWDKCVEWLYGQYHFVMYAVNEK